MREQSLAGQAAFAPANTADIADAMIVSSGLRVEVDRRRGRGAGLNPTGRFEPLQRETVDDGWQTWEELPPFKTEVQVEKPRTAITRNESPDLSFDRSINPIAAASTDASIVSPGRHTPIWGFPQGSISRRSSLPSPMR